MKTVDVVMIEDNPGDVVLMRAAAEKAGLPYHVTVIPNGVEGSDYLLRTGKHAGAARPELVVLDLKLPRRSGREVLEDIRIDPAIDAIPLVVLSSSLSELAHIRLNRRPNQLVLDKPSTFSGYVELLQTIEAFRLSAPGGEGGGSTGETP